MYNLLKGRLLAVRLVLLVAVASLITIGIITIYSLGHPVEPSLSGQVESLSNLWKKQLIFACIGAGAFIAVNLTGYRRLGAVSCWLYAVTVLLLAVLLLDKWIDLPFVPVINNARRWLRIGVATRYVQLQPSEFCKLLVSAIPQ